MPAESPKVVNPLDSNTWKLILLLMQGMFFPWMVWASLKLVDVETDLRVVQEDVFTSTDALILQDEITRNSPPIWFRNQFESWTQTAREHEKRLDEIERRMRLQGG